MLTLMQHPSSFYLPLLLLHTPPVGTLTHAVLAACCCIPCLLPGRPLPQQHATRPAGEKVQLRLPSLLFTSREDHLPRGSGELHSRKERSSPTDFRNSRTGCGAVQRTESACGCEGKGRRGDGLSRQRCGRIGEQSAGFILLVVVGWLP